MANKIKRLRIGLVNAQVVGHDRIVLAHLCLVIARLADLERVIQEDHRVEPQCGSLVIAREEGIAPAQWHRVFQVHVLDTA
ncbi:hypothetical protein D3C72_822790 [compost metagenome]